MCNIVFKIDNVYFYLNQKNMNPHGIGFIFSYIKILFSEKRSVYPTGEFSGKYKQAKLQSAWHEKVTEARIP